MGQNTSLTQPRIVLDTNCVLSALLFTRGRLTWLREAWRQPRFTPLVSRATVEELIRVLHYPRFRLTAEERDALLADYLPYAETVTVALSTPEIGVRDPDDEAFIALATAAHADAIVTGDADLHALSDQIPSRDILYPAAFDAWLKARGK